MLSYNCALDMTPSYDLGPQPALSTVVTRSVCGGAEPARQPIEQSGLIVADPCHVPVRPQQRGGHVQLSTDIDDVVDAVRPTRHGQLSGLVHQEPAPVVHQSVEVTLPELDIPQPAADERMIVAEVVPDPGRGDPL